MQFSGGGTAESTAAAQRADAEALLDRLAPAGAITGHLRRLQVQQERMLATFAAIERQLRTERAGHPDLPYWLVTLAAGVERTNAVLDWSDQALAALKGR